MNDPNRWNRLRGEWLWVAEERRVPPSFAETTAQKALGGCIEPPIFDSFFAIVGVLYDNFKENVIQEGPASRVKQTMQDRYGGYYTGRVLWRKDQRWGDLQFGASSSLLTPPAEGAAFRRNHKLYVTVGGGTSRTTVSTDGAPRYEGRDVVGHVSFVPAERQNHGCYCGHILECLALEISPGWLARCLDVRDASSIEFLAATNRLDPLIFNLMLALRDEAEVGGPAGRLFAETAGALICLHLIRHYSNVGVAFKAHNSNKIAATDFEQVIEFIEEHLGTDLPLNKLAEIADMSPSSFVRSFRDATKMSPHKYVLHRRLLRAQQLLRSSNLSISVIAYDLGFSSQSHFSTVFRSSTGVSPARYRQQFLRKRW